MKVFYRRRRWKNPLCTGVLITCIICFVSLLLLESEGPANHSIFYQYISSSTVHRLLAASSKPRAINHSKPLIDFPHTVSPVLDESGYFVSKVSLVLEGKRKDALVDHNSVGSPKHTKEVLYIAGNYVQSNKSLVSDESSSKGDRQSDYPRSADDLVDILDSKISQIPRFPVEAEVPVDADLADDFLQIHKVLKPAPKPQKPVRILIITNRRSGSSFLGQMFNQNPNIFFNFEPLKVLERKPGVYANQTVFLKLLLSCKFKKMPFLMEFYNKERLHRSSSLALSSPPLCTHGAPVNSTNIRLCEKLHPTFSGTVCARYSNTAAKLIRLYNISSLEELVTKDNMNLKIVHLVRDPRGILSSRSIAEKRTLEVGKILDREAGYLCRRMRSNLRLATSNPPWLEGRYKLLRYEDIAYNPEKWVREIYKFTGLGTVNPEVLSWIRTNTKVQSKETYSTSRFSQEIAEAWRKNISLPVAMRIDEVCKEVMNFLKYEPVHNFENLRKMDQSLVKQL